MAPVLSFENWPVKRAYTAGDDVAGVLSLDLKKDVSLKCIRVKLSCVAYTEVRSREYGHHRHHSRRTRTYTQYTTYLKIKSTVWTPESTGMDAANATLARKEWKFPFSIRIPDSNTLPESLYISSKANVRWVISATAERASFFKPNLKTNHQLEYYPLLGPRPSNDEIVFVDVGGKDYKFEPFEPGSVPTNPSIWQSFKGRISSPRVHTKINLRVQTPNTGLRQWPQGCGLQLFLMCMAPNLARVSKVRIELETKYIWSAQGRFDKSSSKSRIYESNGNSNTLDETLRSGNFFGVDTAALVLPSLFASTQSLSTIQITHKLRIRVYIDSCDGNYTKHYDLKVPVSLEPVAGEYIARGAQYCSVEPAPIEHVRNANGSDLPPTYVGPEKAPMGKGVSVMPENRKAQY